MHTVPMLMLLAMAGQAFRGRVPLDQQAVFLPALHRGMVYLWSWESRAWMAARHMWTSKNCTAHAQSFSCCSSMWEMQ